MSVNYNPATPTDGLVLCLDTGNRRSYPGSGNTWFDISGQNNHGTLTNGAALNTGFGGGISFDGVNDYVDINSLQSITTQYTLSAWINLSSIRNYNVFFYRGNSNSGDIEFYTAGAAQSITVAHNRNNGGTFFYAANNNSTAGAPNIGNWGAFPTNTISHYLLTYNNNTWRMYRNGIQIGNSVTGVSNPSSVSSVWRIGGTPNTATFTDINEWSGIIEDVRIYNRALSPPEIYQLFSSKRGRFGV